MNKEEILAVAKPILFNTEMVRAILREKNPKTVTRRILKTDKYIPEDAEFGYTAFTPERHISCRGAFVDEAGDQRYGESFIKLSYFSGDILYVRETWQKMRYKRPEVAIPVDFKECEYVYLADHEICNSDGTKFKWKPSIFMPKEAARIFLRVTSVRVERLQDIDGYGVLSEGVDNGKSNSAMGNRWENMQRMAYSELWNSTIKKSDIAKYGWVANPWVTVNEFERLEVK